jgi:hypothetical protein
MNVPSVRDELTRHLSENWNSIVDREVDGKNSIPYLKDQPGTHYSRHMAARRVSRTIMLGSAPTGREQSVRGIEKSRIRLGVVQPGESIPVFNDAINALRNELSYLYSNPSGDRYWYDNRPTLRKTAEDRATQVSDIDAEYEIEKRLHKFRKEHPFSGVHICPASSLDVPDEQSTRLVVLRPEDQFKASNESNPALLSVNDILNNRGNSPRMFRNMLAFVAPDQDLMRSLKQEVKRFLAWRSIKEDSQDLNLDAAQNRETENSLGRSNETVDAQIKETYCWLLIPVIDRNTDMKTIQWDRIRISGGNETIVQKAAKKMLQNEEIIDRWAPVLMRMELDNLLWRDDEHISIKGLWEYLCTYCYLPRLANVRVFEETIQTGLESSEYFAFASGFDGERYIGLRFNQYVGTIEHSGYLVKVEVARKQLAEEEAKRKAEEEGKEDYEPDNPTPPVGGTGGTTVFPGDQGSGGVDVKEEPVTQKIVNFHMSAELDLTRINRDVQKLMEEVINHIINADGSSVQISLEVTAKAEAGFTPETVRTVSENSRTLKVERFGFSN